MTIRAYYIVGTGTAISLALLVSSSSRLLAQAAASSVDLRWGTIESPSNADRDRQPLPPAGAIAAANKFTSAQYSTGGIGLRNLGSGALHVSGVTPPVKGAFLYWAVITSGAPPATDKSVTLTQIFPAKGKSASLTGTVIGTGASPCWIAKSATITVYKATVPTADVTGNGTYQIAFKTGASGSTKGEDPWLAAVPPLLEGASLVVVGTGSGTVYVYDKGLAGTTFGQHTNPETFTYSLTLSTATTGGQVLFDMVGADGQIGTSRTAGISSANQPYIAAKGTAINGQAVAGPINTTYIDYDSDWNGNAAAPLPRLWDDVGHNITTSAPSGTKTLTVEFETQGDCLTPVANVVGAY